MMIHMMGISGFACCRLKIEMTTSKFEPLDTRVANVDTKIGELDTNIAQIRRAETNIVNKVKCPQPKTK